MTNNLATLRVALTVFAPLCALAAPAHCSAQTPASASLSTPSPDFTPDAILAVMKRVADWQLPQPARRSRDDWTYGALYAGMMALSRIAEDPKYHDATMAMGRQQEWKPGKRIYHADDQCVCQTYLELYAQQRESAMLGPTKERFDYILEHPKTNDLRFGVKGATDRWAWCDALFMAPAAWLQLSEITQDPRYAAFMDREWRATSDFLYDESEHLYYRDSTYFDRREANGKKVFWSRGDGWVLAGLARVLPRLPHNFATKDFYERQFREMSEKIATLQCADGLWHSSLLAPDDYPAKETSGSGFFTFALAWGINNGRLDRSAYEPVVRKGWKALVECVTPEGKLEHIQPIGANPRKFDPTWTDVYGVGAFLLAGSEAHILASQAK
jgi:unsaturated rhamnogalacturonyl hydrolase